MAFLPHIQQQSMEKSEAVLLKKAKKLESQGLQQSIVKPERAPVFEELLHNVLHIRHPKPIDYFNRIDLIRIFNVISKEIHGNGDDFTIVEGFGSFLMDMFSAGSDLDLSINFGNYEVEVSRAKRIQTLRKFEKKLKALQRIGHVSNVILITGARVPILKITDRGTGIECDISVENRDGIAKSRIIRMVSSIDHRFQKLSFLMKAWAKAHDINSSKEHTLNSLSIILLVAFHLQTRDPPILPPFSVILKDGSDMETVTKNVINFLGYGEVNKESLAELFVTLLLKLQSIETLWSKGLCASIYDGSWIYKTWDSGVGCINVEDFTDRSQNVARAVATKQVTKIYKCIHHSLHWISVFMNGRMEGPKLRRRLFGQDHVPKPLSGPGQLPVPEDGGKSLDENAASALTQDDFIQTKKPRLMDGWAGQKHDSVELASNVAWPSTQHLVYQAHQFAPGPPQLPFSPLQNPVCFAGSQSLNVMPPMPSMGPMHGWGGQQHAPGAATSTAAGPFAIPFAYQVLQAALGLPQLLDVPLQQPASAPLQTMLHSHGLQGSTTTVPRPSAELPYARHN